MKNYNLLTYAPVIFCLLSGIGGSQFDEQKGSIPLNPYAPSFEPPPSLSWKDLQALQNRVAEGARRVINFDELKVNASKREAIQTAQEAKEAAQAEVERLRSIEEARLKAEAEAAEEAKIAARYKRAKAERAEIERIRAETAEKARKEAEQAEAERLKSIEEARLKAETEAKEAERKAAEQVAQRKAEADAKAKAEAKEAERLRHEAAQALWAQKAAQRQIAVEKARQQEAKEAARLKAEAEAKAKAEEEAKADEIRRAEQAVQNSMRLRAEAEALGVRIAKEQAAQRAKVAEIARLEAERKAQETQLKAEQAAQAAARREAERKALAGFLRVPSGRASQKIAPAKPLTEAELAQEALLKQGVVDLSEQALVELYQRGLAYCAGDASTGVGYNLPHAQEIFGYLAQHVDMSDLVTESHPKLLTFLYGIGVNCMYGVNNKQDIPTGLELLAVLADKNFLPAMRFLVDGYLGNKGGLMKLDVDRALLLAHKGKTFGAKDLEDIYNILHADFEHVKGIEVWSKGQIHLGKKDYGSAKLCFEEAKTLEYPEAYVSLAKMSLKGEGAPKNLSHAVNLMEDAVRLAPHNAAILYDMASVYEAVKRPADARVQYAKSVFLYEQAAARGHADSMAALVKLYLAKPQEYPLERALIFLGGLVKDHPDARDWCRVLTAVCETAARTHVSVDDVLFLKGIIKKTRDNKKLFGKMLTDLRKKSVEKQYTVSTKYLDALPKAKDAVYYFEAGKQKNDVGDHANAIKDLMQAKAMGSSDAAVLLATMHMNGVGVERNGPEAITLYEEAVRLSPDTYTRYNLGIGYTAVGDERGSPLCIQVIGEVEAMVNQEIVDLKAIEFLADICTKQPYLYDFNKLDTLLRPLAASQDRDVRAWVGAVKIIKHAQDQENLKAVHGEAEALKVLLSRFTSREMTTSAPQARAHAIAEAQKRSQALGHTICLQYLAEVKALGEQVLAKPSPKDEVDWFATGKAKYALEDYPGAIADLMKAKGDNPYACSFLGMMHLEGKGFPENTAEAVKFFEESLKLDPENPDLLSNLATGYTAIGREADANRAFKAAIAGWENGIVENNYYKNIVFLLHSCINPSGLYTLDRLIKLLGPIASRGPEVEAWLDSVMFIKSAQDEWGLKPQPDEAEALKVLMCIFNSPDMQQSSLHVHAMAIEGSRQLSEQLGHSIALKYLAILAEKCQGIVVDPNQVKASTLLEQGRQQSDPKEAILLFEKALALTPQDPTIQCNLGLVYKMVGRDAEATQRVSDSIVGFEAGAAQGNRDHLISLGQLSVANPDLYPIARAIEQLQAHAADGDNEAFNWLKALNFIHTEQRTVNDGAAAGAAPLLITLAEAEELINLQVSLAILANVSAGDRGAAIASMLDQYRANGFKFCIIYLERFQNPESHPVENTKQKKKV